MPSLRIAICLFILTQSIFAGTQATLYVSPDGGGNNFSLAQPGNLFDARDYIRTINTNMTGDIVVYLEGGAYQLTNSFQLQENSTNHDSGNSGYNIVYENYPGETPIISGGTLVTNWSLFDASSNIWRTFVGTGVNSRQLFVNGLRAIRARGPINPSGFVTNKIGTGFWTTNTAMQSWSNQTNIEIVCRNAWKQLRCPIQSISGTNIIMQTPGWTYSGNSPTPGRPWNGNGHRSLVSVSWVENAYELLDSAGMWYLNEATGYLYYIPRPGENLTNGTVVVMPTVEKLIDAEGGDYTTPIHNVIFSGIAFEYGTWLLPSTSAGYADNQTSILWPGPTGALKTLANVSFQTASDIQVTNCDFEHLGGVGLDFGTGAHNNLIIGNQFDDISSCGITLGEVTDYASTDENQMTDSNSIEDNFIRRCGVDYEDGIGIFVCYAKNTFIAHNDIDNMPYSGICLGWGWGTTNYSENNQVTGNFVGKVMQTLSDGGQCYSLSAESNSVNAANYYKDSGYQGIYWDEGSAYWLAISNVFDNVAQNYIHFNSSSGTLNNHDNIGTNNFINGSSFNSKGTNDVVTNTVTVKSQFWPVAAQQIILQAGLEPAFAQIKSPEFFVNGTEPNFDHVPSGWALSSARGYGDYHGDVHYTTTDGDYLQYTFSASAISWIGEMNLDMSNVDVYLDGTFQQTVNCYSATRVTQARLFTATNLSAGTHTVKLVKNGGTYMMLDAFAVTPNEFWLTVTTNASTVIAGNSTNSMIKLDTFGNYSGTTTFSVNGLPSGASASFSSPSVTGAGFSTMTISTTSATPAGNYTLLISGASSDATNSTTMSLTVVGGPANLRWNSIANSTWDISSSFNWLNIFSNSSAQFHNGDNVLLDDTTGLTNTIAIASGVAVTPAIITNNSDARNYTITGAGKISGSASLVKSGASTLTLNTTNDFSGGVIIGGGILRAGTSAALGSNGGSTIITNGGALDVNGFNLTAEPIVVSGDGANGNGAIINSGASQISALRQVTLAGDVTFGGTNRWDIRNTGGTASLSTTPSGSAFKITKVGTNQISLVAVTSIDSALGDIDIQQGELAIQTTTAQIGDPTKTITVHSNATLEIWNLTNSPLNKQIVLNDGSTFFNENGISMVAGPVTLNGNDTFNCGGVSLIFSNAISGAGNLIKIGLTNLILVGTNIYSGNTIVSNGILSLVANGSISSSATIVINSGATLDASGRGDKTLTLAAGQTLQGNGTLNGSLTVATNAIVSPGNSSTGILTVTNVAMLQGTVVMKLNESSATNDVIRGAQTINYGGILSLTNLSGTLAANDSFKLFSANNYGGAFAKILPAIPRAGLVWDSSQLNSGILKITTGVTSRPQVRASMSGGNLILAGGTNSLAGVTFYLLASTNVASPLTNWISIATNVFDVNGNFSMTNSPGTNARKFFVIQVP